MVYADEAQLDNGLATAGAVLAGALRLTAAAAGGGGSEVTNVVVIVEVRTVLLLQRLLMLQFWSMLPCT